MAKNNLSHRSQKRLDAMLEALASIAELHPKFIEPELKDLVRRDAVGIDPSFPGRSGESIGFTKSSTISSPTERAAIQLAEGRQARDPFRAEMKKIENAILDSAHALERAYDALDAAKSRETQVRERETSTPCEICQLLPAKKAAKCAGCYDDWEVNGRPDPALWRIYKTEATTTPENPSHTGELLMSYPPPPSVRIGNNGQSENP